MNSDMSSSGLPIAVSLYTLLLLLLQLIKWNSNLWISVTEEVVQVINSCILCLVLNLKSGTKFVPSNFEFGIK